MKTAPLGIRGFRRCLFASLRFCVCAALVALLASEILPVRYVERVPAASCGDAGGAFRIEPLQVCDFGDPLLGGIVDLPVLPPEALFLLPSSEAMLLMEHAAAFSPDGFHPGVDRPPRRSA